MTQCEEIPSGVRVVRRGVHRAWWMAAVAALVIGCAGAVATMAGLLVDPLHREFGWSRGVIGVAVSVNMVLYGLAAPLAAAVTDRFGIRRVAAGALAAIASGAALLTVMTSAWQLVLYWGVLVGAGAGSLAMTFAATVTARWFVARRGLVTGILAAASVFGQFAFLPVLSWIVEHHGWRLAVLTVAGAALLVAAAAGRLLRDHPADVDLAAYGATRFAPKPAPVRGAASRAVQVLRTSVRTGPFWLLTVTFAICGASTNGVMWTHFAPAAHDHGMPMTVAASLLASIGVCNVLGTIGSGWLTDRVDAGWLLAACYALRGVALLCVPLLFAATVRPSMVLFVVVFGLLDVATVPPTIALCRARYGTDGAVVFGWVNTGHQIGAGLVAVLGGTARDLLGSYDPVWLATAALCAVAALLAPMISRSGEGFTRAGGLALGSDGYAKS